MPTRRQLTLFAGFLTLIVTFMLIVFSESAFNASMDGLTLFAEVVLPSLLPFFILSEILYALGMVHFLGIIFEPLMRPVFNVPGAGSFIFSMGLAAGYPMDAVLTGKFRREGLCTRIESERLLAFSNTADPLFIFGAVAVGMFGRPELGATMALAHYLSVLLVGFAFRFYGREAEQADAGRSGRGRRTDIRGRERGRTQRRSFQWGRSSRPGAGGAMRRRTDMRRGPRAGILRRAVAAAYTAYEEDGRPFGQVLNDAIFDSARTLLKILAFIVLFAVLLAVLQEAHILKRLEAPLGSLLALLGMDPALSKALLTGLFEIDLGTSMAAASGAPMGEAVVICSAIIAWSGFSVHGQVASILSGTDIRMRPFMYARMLHALSAAVLTVLLLEPVSQMLGDWHLPVFDSPSGAGAGLSATVWASALTSFRLFAWAGGMLAFLGGALLFLLARRTLKWRA